MSRCSSHRQCLDQACSTSPLSRISSKTRRGHRETIERFCCFYSGPQTIPFIGVGAFRFYCSFAYLQAPPISSSGMEHLPFSAYIRNTHGIFMMPALFLVIKYALTKSVINNKNPTKICPKFNQVSRRFITHTIRGREITTHRLGIFLIQSGCKRTTILLSSFHFRRELGQHWGK